MKQVLFILLLAATSIAFGHSYSSFNDSLLIGTWTGTSLCQVRSSPCHDEIAVCHISKGSKPNTFHFIMNKMVSGKEEDVGVLDYVYDASARTLTSIDEKRKLVWKFTLMNKTMEGTLFYNNVLYRVIKLNKVIEK